MRQRSPYCQESFFLIAKSSVRKQCTTSLKSQLSTVFLYISLCNPAANQNRFYNIEYILQFSFSKSYRPCRMNFIIKGFLPCLYYAIISSYISYEVISFYSIAAISILVSLNARTSLYKHWITDLSFTLLSLQSYLFCIY